MCGDRRLHLHAELLLVAGDLEGMAESVTTTPSINADGIIFNAMEYRAKRIREIVAQLMDLEAAD